MYKAPLATHIKPSATRDYSLCTDMSDQFTYPAEIREQLAGKTVLVIGAGGTGRRTIWTSLKCSGVKVVLVDPSSDNHGVQHVDTCIQYDYRDQTKLDTHADMIIQLLRDRREDVSGCVTFSEHCAIPLASIVCRKLGLPGAEPEAALITMSKHRTYEILRSRPHGAEFRTDIYAPMSFRIEKADDITKVKPLSYPAILKPEYESLSKGINRVTSMADCLKKYEVVQTMYGKNWNGKGFGNSMVLMELLQGSSYDVDVVIYDGECLAAFVTDMGPALPEVYATTTTCTPTSLPVQMKENLTTAAFHCCRQVGLCHGVYNLEFKINKCGTIKLVEINGRIACCRRCTVYKTTENVDLWEIGAAVACGIKPYFPNAGPQCYAVGSYLYPLYHGMQLSKADVMAQVMELVEAKDILLIMSALTVKVVVEEFQIPFGHLVALGDSKASARRKLIKAFTDLGLMRDDFDIESFTET